MPHSRQSVALFAVLFALGACGSDEPAGPLTLDALPILTATEEARWGDAADPALGFTFITGVDLDRDGNVYVFEGSVPEIRVHHPTGARIGTVGRGGQGPGEFSGPVPFGVMGDSIWTFESGVNRLTLFDLEGEVLSTGVADRVQVPLPNGIGLILPREPGDDGLFHGAFDWISFTRDPTGVEPTDSIPWPLVRFRADGSVADTLGWVPRPPPKMWRPPSEQVSEPQIIRIGQRPFMVPQANVRLPDWHMVGPERIEVIAPPPEGPEASLHLRRIDLEGDTLFESSLVVPAMRYTPTMLDSLAAAAATTGGFGRPLGAPSPDPVDNSDEVAAQLRAEMDFPEFATPLNYSRLGEDESVWIRLHGDDGAGNAVWVIMEGDGGFRGRLALPPRVVPQWTSGDTVWATVTDDLDIPWLVRYRLSEAG